MPRKPIDDIRDTIESKDETVDDYFAHGLCDLATVSRHQLAKAVAVAAAEIVDESERSRLGTLALKNEVESLRADINELTDTISANAAASDAARAQEGLLNRGEIDVLTKGVGDLVSKLEEVRLDIKPVGPAL
jgi:methyl-accepting chemotaxis protein